MKWRGMTDPLERAQDFELKGGQVRRAWRANAIGARQTGWWRKQKRFTCGRHTEVLVLIFGFH